MHAKTDSEATSYASSPPCRQELYYVQSPSHESTPAHTPIGSPHHPANRGQHSREFSNSRFSGSLKPGGSGLPPSQADQRGGIWREGDPIDEEEAGLLEDDMNQVRGREGIPRRFYVLGFVLAFFVLFFFFALILWGASHNKHPIITVNSITFHEFTIQAGTDASWVPTGLSTLKSTVNVTYRNTGTFFGIHVSSTPLVLYYNILPLATGNINKFYQSRKSHRSLSVLVKGEDVPIYGAATGLGTGSGKDSTGPIPLSLNFTIRSRAYVLGKLVKPKFYSIVQCSLKLDQTKLGTATSLKDSCQYSD